MMYPFSLCTWKQGCHTRSVNQQHGSYYWPIGYLLDTVAKGLPPGLQAVTATAMLCQTTEETVMSHPLTVPQSMEAFLSSHHTHPASRLTSRETVLFSPNITPTGIINLIQPACTQKNQRSMTKRMTVLLWLTIFYLLGLSFEKAQWIILILYCSLMVPI